MPKKHSHFSLFSGAGGLDLGFKQAGSYKILFGNDILGDAVETYSENFKIQKKDTAPKSSNLPAVFQKDITEIDFEPLESVDPNIVVGGPPCQDFSVTRGPKEERKGIDVKRGRLYSHFVRALVHLQPDFFVFENVPGLKSANKGKAYKKIQEDFINLDMEWSEISRLVNNSSDISPEGYKLLFNDIVNAADLGVPQDRRRLIIIGLREDMLDNAWWEGESMKLQKKLSRILKGKNTLLSKYPLTALEVFEGEILPNLKDKYRKIMKEYEVIPDDLNNDKAKSWKKNTFDKLTFDAIEDYLSINGIEKSSQSEIEKAFKVHKHILKELGYWKTKVSDLDLPDDSNKRARESESVIQRMKRIPPDENHDFVRGTKWEVEGRGMSFVYRRLHPLKPSYTVVAKGGGGTWGYHYDRSRSRLTNRERARLQTYPDDFLFKGRKSEVRSQIGEAVPPLLGKRIAEGINKIKKELDK